MKKILILTSSGGGGHLSTSNALAFYLKNDYDTTTLNIFADLLQSLDPLRVLTRNSFGLEDFYNFFIQKNQSWLLTLFYRWGVWFIRLRRKKIEALLQDYCQKHAIDLIISVIPIINNITLTVAQKLDIPFLLIPTDLDTRTYLVDIQNPDYKKFYLAIPFDDPQIDAPIIQAHINKNQLLTIKTLLRPDFFENKNILLLKNKLDIPDNTVTVMILMGARGSHTIEKLCKEMAHIKKPMHLIVCIGTYEKIKKNIEKIRFPSTTTISLVDFTQHISDLMAVSDIIFSKSGSISVYEALCMNKPLLLDATSKVLPWELFNHHFVENHHFGKSIKKYSDIIPLISSLIADPKQLTTYHNNLKAFNAKNSTREITSVIKDIL
jgi:processive 1,2-diacylglycerol beta-glucosyltransferase